MTVREMTKEQARHEFIKMIVKSWTYDRMTKEERKKVLTLFESSPLFGAAPQRWEQLQNIYSAFFARLEL